jgi:predicted ATPase
VTNGKLYCISGPSSSGKTTLLEKLKQKLPEAIFVEEWARRVFHSKYSGAYANMDALLCSKDAFAYQLEMAQLTEGNRVLGRVVVIDRAPIDILVYSLMNLANVGAGVTQIMDIVLRSARDVDVVFMTKDIGKYEEDGFRPEAYRKMRALELNLFQHFAEVIVNKLVWLPDGTEGRVNTVLEQMAEDGVFETRK